MASFEQFFIRFSAIPTEEYEGCTKFGIGVSTLIEYYDDDSITCEDIKVLNAERASRITKILFWDFFLADEIENQSLAGFIVDSGFAMGRRLIAKYVQKIIGLAPDGWFDKETIASLNSSFSKDVFQQLKDKRTQRYLDIINNNASHKKSLKGWFARVNSWDYKA